MKTNELLALFPKASLQDKPCLLYTSINMVESGAKELSADIMLEALLKGHEAVKELIAFQEEIVAAVGKEKAEVELLHVDEELQAEIIAARCV